MAPYYVYILTNPGQSTLYIGVTNDIQKRQLEHHANRGTKISFASRYYCYNLIYFEEYQDINEAIRREKQLKSWRKEKKLALIYELNPNLDFIHAPTK